MSIERATKKAERKSRKITLRGKVLNVGDADPKSIARGLIKRREEARSERKIGSR